VIQKGITTPQDLPPPRRRFLVDSWAPPCYRDRRGEWLCGHDHEEPLALEDAYEHAIGWTAQM
jgi:hypothetical protein